MPVYLFTYHAYGSWMPDRKCGYVKRGKGVLSSDLDMAGRYRQNMSDSPVTFDPDIQRILIEEFCIASEFQRFELHGIGTDPSHIHGLVSWRDTRGWSKLRNGIRSSLTRRLNREFRRRNWFVDGANRKRVSDRDHFDYLTETYLPDHPGWKWSPVHGLYV